MSASLVKRVLSLLDPKLGTDDEMPQMRSDHINRVDQHADDGVVQFPDRQLRPQETVPLVHAEPRDMEQAHVVAQQIKEQVPVVLNLVDTDPDEANRICDFIYGVTYGMNGKMEQVNAHVYACTPYDMPVHKLDVEAAFPGEVRYEKRDEYDRRRDVY
jgi:FtsZ-interacting cell division protein YlmF